MCYSIPGKIFKIEDNIVTVDYFGQKRKARNDFYSELAIGDYVYAQGGFVVQRIPHDEAISILDTWRELFVKLEEIDLKLARPPKNLNKYLETSSEKELYQLANSVRSKHLGNSCCIHGIIEFSNYCRCNCLYCGIRNGNDRIERYRMDVEEIINASLYAIKVQNFKALVLQSGEDLYYNEERLVAIISNVMKENPIFLIMSIGERDFNLYKRLYDVGARGVLLRFETSNPSLYERYKEGRKLRDRLNLIKELHKLGYVIFTGFLAGLKDQTEEDIRRDIEVTASLNPEMFSFGPFIPLDDNESKPPIELILSTIAKTRIAYPDSRILVTTAVETLYGEDGLISGLASGGNSLMINVTPEKYRNLYKIYPGRRGIGAERAIKLLHSIGRAPTDLGIK